jgi:ABC-type transporter Mla subunit MlaD
MELREELDAVREELDEHLDALNQNTAEIASTHEYVSELDVKLEKLIERVDALQALILSQTPATKTALRLTGKEEDVLQVLTTTHEPLSSAAIGRRCGLTPDLAAQTLYCLKQKGVKVLATSLGEETLYGLDGRFVNES